MYTATDIHFSYTPGLKTKGVYEKEIKIKKYRCISFDIYRFFVYRYPLDTGIHLYIYI